MEVVTDSIVRLNLTGGANSSIMNEHRFNKSLTVAELKAKLEMIMGVGAAGMKLAVYGGIDDKLLFHMNDADQQQMPIGSFQLDDGMRVDVSGPTLVSTFELGGDNQVEKYEMKDDDYDQKRDSVRSFLKRNKRGKYNPEFQRKQKELEAAKADDEKRYMEEIKVGSRCKVAAPKQPPRRGTVEFVGYTEFKPDLWVGVRLDEPFGKNDGAVEGKRYFQCEHGYGSFVRPKFVECGDFPELSIDDDIDEM